MAETVEQVFWRLVGAGVASGEIGQHPDYQAAWSREHPEGHDCLTCATGRTHDSLG